MESMERVIFHIDVNAAFLSWEAVFRLKHQGEMRDLREIPSAVGGDAALRHGIILAKSLPAKMYGIKTGEAVWEAKQKCPELVLVPPNYTLYESSSRAFMEILRRYTPDVEQYSVDEAFLDMSGTQKLWGLPVQAAERIKAQIREELGFTVNIGISSNKLLAKMASDFKKPDRVHTLFPEEIGWKMWPLPVTDLFFVGRATAKKLFSMGIRTIGDLAASDPEILKRNLKKHGEVIWGLANGIDLSLVEPEPPANKGYGNSTTVPFDVTDESTARMVLLALAETVASRLRKAGVQAELVSVEIKYYDFSHAGHQMVLDAATDITMEIHCAACRLFGELWNGGPIRHLGIHTGRIRDYEKFRQLSLLDQTDYEKLEALDRAVDSVRDRYGIDAVKRAVFLKSPVDHMSGGVSREKWGEL